MTREIKFRGKLIDTGEWVYGNLLQDSGLCFIGKNIEVFKEAPFNECLVNPDTVGQYTGLKDRIGQDVYEGDLLRTPEGNIMIAEWVGSGIVTRCLTPTYDGMMNTNRYAFPVSEKIGNIYDNQKLLENGK